MSTGSQNGTPWIDEDPTPKSKSDALRALKEGVDIPGTRAERYLIEDRRIDLPHPVDFKHWENARTGESALLAPLRVGADGEVVAVQAIYLDHEGHKSAVDPAKQRLSIERAPGAAFYLPYNGDSKDAVVAEGLEDALTVWRYGAVRCRVIGLPGIGALRHLKFPEGTRVAVIADGDAPGSKGAELLQKGLDALILQGCEVLVTATPPEGWDANRLLIEHGVATVQVFVASAKPGTLSDNGKILSLTKLDLLSYGRERKKAAEELEIPVGLLDKIVEKERQRLAEEAKAEKDDWASVDDARPWAEEVDGVELLDDLAKTVSLFVIMAKEAAWAIALWIVFTWCFDAAHCALKLWIKSAEKRSGKTRLVEVLSYLVKKQLAASGGITAAAFFRLIETLHPTVLLDEFDALVAEDPQFRGMLNAGFDRRTAVRYVCVGEDHTPMPFSLWAPQVIAGIGSIPDTVADRSLKVELQRKLRSQKVEKLRRRGTGVLEELAQKCARWSADNIGDLVRAEPEIPESINDRAADGWELLIAIADQVGGHWPQRGRQAAIKLSGDGEYPIEDESIGVQLLHDISAVLSEHPPTGDSPAEQDRVSSASLVSWLVALEDRPWVEFRRGHSMTQHQLSRQLSKYHIRPKSSGDKTRWYSRSALKSAAERYLSSPTPEQDRPPSDGHPNGEDTTHRGPSLFSGGPNQTQTVRPSDSEESCGFRPFFKPSEEIHADGLKKQMNHQQNCQKGRPDGLNTEMPEKAASNGVDEDLDEKPVPPHEPTSIAEEARQLKQANPTWSIKRIAAELGQPEARIARYFAH